MRILTLLSFLLFSLTIVAQKETIETRLVLLTDSIPIFDKKHISTEFTHGYFLVALELNMPFADNEYNLFIEKVSNIHTDIKPFKSFDNKKIICIFPKHAATGIDSFMEFIKGNFPEILISKSKIKYIQAVKSFDPNNKKEEKGFN